MVYTSQGLDEFKLLKLSIAKNTNKVGHVKSNTDAEGGGPSPQVFRPKIEHFWSLLNFSSICITSLDVLFLQYFATFHNSYSNIFQTYFVQHIISQLMHI